jgi:hypothetical protein
MAESSFKDFLDGMVGNYTTGSASNQAGLDFYRQRQQSLNPAPAKPAKDDWSFGQESPNSSKAPRKKTKVPPKPPTLEDHLRTVGKFITCAITIGIIYLCATKLHGDAQTWSIISAVVSAPILYRILVGPLRSLLIAMRYVLIVVLIGGLVTGLIIMIQDIIQEAK